VNLLRTASVPLVALLCALFILMPSANPLVRWAEGRNAEVALAATGVYVSLRAINASLSMAGEVEVGASIGVGGSINPLRWLEPVDDTVERVSSLVFAVAAVSGLLTLALEPLSAIGFGLIALGLAGRAGCRRGLAGRGVARAASGCALLGAGFAVLLPAVIVGGAILGEALTRAEWAEAQETVRLVRDEAAALVGDTDDGWRERYNRLAGAAGFFWENADELLRASITLCGIFALRLVVLPAALLWAALAVLRRAL
jgi:hypothetical protein